MTVLADRYTGRHIRQARHGAWVNKKRSRMTQRTQLLPAAAAFTVAGFLLGGAGAAIASSPASKKTDLSIEYDPADIPPPDRTIGERTSRDVGRAEVPSSPQGAAGIAPNEVSPGLQPKAAIPATAVTGTVLESGDCKASFTDRVHTTANGETFDPTALTASNKSLPFDSLVRVTNPANGQSVVVRVNDRGPYYYADRCLDLSEAAFAAIADTSHGVVDVRYEVLAQDAT